MKSKKILLAFGVVALLSVAFGGYQAYRAHDLALQFGDPKSSERMRWVGPDEADAQVTFSASRGGTGSWGLVQPVWNTVDSTITDGDIVMYDTTAASASFTEKRMGVRHYLGVLSDRKRIAGVAYGDISRSSQGGRGSVLIWGYHNFVKYSLPSGTVGGAPIRVSAITGSVVNAGDSISMQVGYVTGGVAGLSGTMSHVKARVNFLTFGKLAGSL
jgi:hypothetical protein